MYIQKVLGGLMIMPTVSPQRAQHNEGLPVHMDREAFKRCCVFDAGYRASLPPAASFFSILPTKWISGMVTTK